MADGPADLDKGTIDELKGDVPRSLDVNEALAPASEPREMSMTRLNIRRLEFRQEMLDADLADRRQTAALRGSFASVIKWAMIATLAATGLLMAAYLLLTTFFEAELDTAVMVAWFSSTVVQVIGLAYVVANYLFPTGQTRRARRVTD